jgi:glutathione S-transferase
MLALYSHPDSTYTHRVRIALAFKSFEYEIIPIALQKLENRKRPFLAINPYAKVPVLKDEEFLLSESTAILRYLEEKYPTAEKYIPEDTESRALMNQYANQCETEFCFPGSFVYFAKRFVKEEKWDLVRMKEYSKKIGRHLDILDMHLAEHEYIINDKFGFVEIMYAPFIFNIRYLDVEIPEHFKRWMDRVLSHKAVKAVLG